MILLAKSPTLCLYVDPGSGALLWQALVALVAGVAFSLRNLFKRPRKEVPAERREEA